jgi:hypothetical protein
MPNGPEMMLKALGLGPMLDAANMLATSGALPKIIEFADRLPKIIEQLDRIEAYVSAIQPDTDAGLSENRKGEHKDLARPRLGRNSRRGNGAAIDDGTIDASGNAGSMEDQA